MRRVHYIAGAVVLGLSTIALAQSPPTESRADPADVGTQNLGEATDARKLIGKTVQTPGGESLGKVSDVLIDQSHGSEYAIITYGQRRFTAIPLARARSMIKNDVLVLERGQLEKAPALADQAWRKPGSAHWRTSTDKYWESSDRERLAAP